MATNIVLSDEMVMVRAYSVDDFYQAVQNLLVAGYAPYTPLIGSRTGCAVSQAMFLTQPTDEYFLIVSEGLEQHARRMSEMSQKGWNFMFVSEQFDGKYLQWMSRSLTGKVNASRIPYPLEVTKEAPQTFAGLFIKHTQRLSVDIPVRVVVGGVVL